MTRSIRYLAVLSLGTLVIAAGCSSPAERSDNTSASSSGGGAQSKPRVQEVEIPSGTTLVVALDERLGTDTHQSGDRFNAHTTNAVVVDRTTVLPVGSAVRGHLSRVEEPHRTKGKAAMTLVFDEVVDAEGRTHSISASPISLEGKGDAISDEEKVAGGAVIGGIIGALASKNRGKGAAVGAAAGAAAGGAVALATKSGQLELPAGQRFEVELTQSVEMRVASATY